MIRANYCSSGAVVSHTNPLNSLADRILKIITQAQDDSSRLLHLIFKAVPDKKEYPDYYVTIKRPIALSDIKQKLKSKEYDGFDEFIKDIAQIFWNAKFYNSRMSQVYKDAQELESLIENELSEMKNEGLIDRNKLPNLGPLPPESPPEVPPLPSNAQMPLSSLNSPRADAQDMSSERSLSVPQPGYITAPDGTIKRRRGRPPKIETPTEMRINYILKALRRCKDHQGRLMLNQFEKLPETEQFPEYYQYVQAPIALENIRRKLRVRGYHELGSFAADMDLMFRNAKIFSPESAMYRDADYLQNFFQQIIAQVAVKPDDEFASAVDNIQAVRPVRTVKQSVHRILRNGQHYDIGDFVHIRNPNDESKSIPAQIFKIWQDQSGDHHFSACWYYRPEQTVHRADRTFYENEIYKTEQFQEHRPEDIVGKCFIMFITRYARGRPKEANDHTVYVCEYSYNPETRVFTRIKSWGSCQPIELRNQDYEMFFFTRPQILRRVLSPLIDLLQPHQSRKASSIVPEPVMGSEDGPPVVGAIIPAPVPDIDVLNAQCNASGPPILQTDLSSTVSSQDLRRLASIQNMRPGPQLPAAGLFSRPSSLHRLGIGMPSSSDSAAAQHLPDTPVAYTLPILYPSTPGMPLRSNAVPEATARFFKRDVFGRVVWFPTPPQDVIADENGYEHSLKYLLEKAKNAEKLRKDIQNKRSLTTSSTASFKSKSRATSGLIIDAMTDTETCTMKESATATVDDLLKTFASSIMQSAHGLFKQVEAT